jgi:Resolvase, N terminal domain
MWFALEHCKPLRQLQREKFRLGRDMPVYFSIAYGYMRTSSATNVGADKDSEGRQRHAIESYAKTHGYDVAGWYYDAAVRGADPVADRPGFGDNAGGHRRRRRAHDPDRESRPFCARSRGASAH